MPRESTLSGIDTTTGACRWPDIESSDQLEWEMDVRPRLRDSSHGVLKNVCLLRVWPWIFPEGA